MPPKRRKATPVAKKLEILQFWEKCDSMADTTAHFYPNLTDVAYDSQRKDIYVWRKNKDKIVAAASRAATSWKRKCRPVGSGKKLSDDTELKIVRWVNRLRGEGVPISMLMLAIHARRVAVETGKTNFKASSDWLRRFLRRHRLSMRTRTRQGQIKPEDAERLAAEFGEKVRRKMEELGVTVVYNADQTAVFFEYIPKRTIDRRGSKTVWAHPSKLLHVQVENLIERQGFGRYLWPRVGRMSSQHALHITTNPTGWWNEYLHRDFLTQHFGSRENMDQLVLLLLDEFSGHWTDMVLEHATKLNVHLMPVPPGVTSVCQPADVSWMRPFKDHVRSEWVDNLRQQVASHKEGTTFKMKAPKMEDVWGWIRSSWDKVTKSSIMAGYKRTGISIDASDVVARLDELGQLDSEVGEVDSDLTKASVSPYP